MEQILKQKITKDMAIGDVVKKYPEVVETLLSLGVHCVGCHVSYWETLEQGFAGHGMTDQQIEEAVKKLNEAIQEAKEETDLFLTDKAVNKIKAIIKEKNYNNKGLRIKIKAGGCAGHTYMMDFDDKAEDDMVVEQNNISVIMDKESFNSLKGSKLDYIEDLQSAGFKISNPNAKATCGCGQSFS